MTHPRILGEIGFVFVLAALCGIAELAPASTVSVDVYTVHPITAQGRGVTAPRLIASKSVDGATVHVAQSSKAQAFDITADGSDPMRSAIPAIGFQGTVTNLENAQVGVLIHVSVTLDEPIPSETNLHGGLSVLLNHLLGGQGQFTHLTFGQHAGSPIYRAYIDSEATHHFWPAPFYLSTTTGQPAFDSESFGDPDPVPGCAADNTLSLWVRFELSPYARVNMNGSFSAQPASVSPCPADLNGDDTVDVLDMLNLFANWGMCFGECAADLNGDGFIDTIDLLVLMSMWGPCP